MPVVVFYWKVRSDVQYNIIKETMGREYENERELGIGLTGRMRCLGENGMMGFKVWVELLRLRLD